MIRAENNAIGLLVYQLRWANRPMTQAKLAKMIGLSRASVAHIETGRKGMSRSSFYKMCDQLDITCRGVKFGWVLHHMGDWCYILPGAELIVTCRSTDNILLQGIVTSSSTGNFRLESDVTSSSTA